MGNGPGVQGRLDARRGEPFPISPLEAIDEHGAKTLVFDSRPGRGYAETASVLAAMQWWM